MGELERKLELAVNAHHRRVIVVTDGVFSMRGDHAPLDRVMQLARAFDDSLPEGAIVLVDDSHGVGAFGRAGRGTEEYTRSAPADLLVATLGKALGVNGGYLVADETIVRYLRETSPFYVYSNPITPPEAAAACTAIDLLDHPDGVALLDHLRAMAARFRSGLTSLGFETLPASTRSSHCCCATARGPRRWSRTSEGTASLPPAFATPSCRKVTRRSAFRSVPIILRRTLMMRSASSAASERRVSVGRGYGLPVRSTVR